MYIQGLGMKKAVVTSITIIAHAYFSYRVFEAGALLAEIIYRHRGATFGSAC